MCHSFNDFIQIKALLRGFPFNWFSFLLYLEQLKKKGANQMKNFIDEFKEFAFKGNVLDLAVGVVIGAAFTAIVTSLVEDIIMPLVGIIAGGNDVSSLSLKIGTTTLAYGAFLQAVINFLLIAFVVFMFIKLINKIGRAHV